MKNKGSVSRSPPKSPAPSKNSQGCFWVLAIVALVFAAIVALLPADLEKHDITPAVREKWAKEGTLFSSSEGPGWVTAYNFYHGKGAGTSPPESVALLVHGGTSGSFTYSDLVDSLVEAGISVVTFDRYGIGRSDRIDVPMKQEVFVFQIQSLLRDLRSQRKINEYTKLHLLGYSFGGPVIASFAKEHPKDVASVTFFAPVVHYSGNALLLAILRVPVLGPLLLRYYGMQKMSSRAGAIPPEVVAAPGRPSAASAALYKYRWDEQLSYRGYQTCFTSVAKFSLPIDYEDVYRDVAAVAGDVPMLLLWGTADEEISREEVAQLEQVFPNMQSRFLEGLNHAFPVWNPDIVAPIVSEFMLAASPASPNDLDAEQAEEQ